MKTWHEGKGRGGREGGHHTNEPGHEIRPGGLACTEAYTARPNIPDIAHRLCSEGEGGGTVRLPEEVIGEDPLPYVDQHPEPPNTGTPATSGTTGCGEPEGPPGEVGPSDGYSAEGPDPLP